MKSSIHVSYEPNFEQVFFIADLDVGDLLQIDSENPRCWVDVDVSRRDQTGPLIHIRESSDRYSFELGCGYLLGSTVRADNEWYFEPGMIVQGGLLLVMDSRNGTTSEIPIPEGNMRKHLPSSLPILADR
jgi:hypothetical protein